MDQGKEHLTAQQVEDFRRLLMNAAERAQWERHMASCNACLDRVYGGEGSSLPGERLAEAFLVSTEDAFHLSRDDLKRYSSGLLDQADRTIFESHLEDCPACLGRAQAAVHARPDDEAATLQPAQPPSLVPGPPPFWRRPAFALLARVAAAAAAVGCIFLGWAVWYRMNSRSDQAGHNASQGGASAIAVRVHDGSRELTLDQAGTLAGLESLAPAEASAVREALATGQLAKPGVLSELSGAPIKLMGQNFSPPPFALIRPLNTVVSEAQPRLSWGAMSGAAGYTVAVFDSQFRLVTKSPLLKGTEWSLPAPLRRNTTYFWQVAATKENRQVTVPVAPASRAAFKVLDSQTASDLATTRAIAPGAHLTLGILYARAGLRDDAERELEAAAQENPQSPIVARLLSDLRSWAR